MKILTFIIALSLSTFMVQGQAYYEPSSTISEAVVYESGAMITRIVDCTDIYSDGIIRIDSLPQKIRTKSIQALCGTGLEIVSVKHTANTLVINDDQRKDSVRVEIASLKDSIDYQNALLKSIQKEIDVIEHNDQFSTKEGTNIDQLVKASNFYKSQLRALNLEHLRETKTKSKLQSRQAQLERSLQQITPVTFENKGLEIKVKYASEINKSLSITYFTPNASWNSFYDLRVEKSSAANSLNHKAFVSQSTEEDWTDIKLTLSNQNPNRSMSPPTLKPYILQNTNHRSFGQSSSTYPTHQLEKGYLYGQVIDRHTGEPLLFARVAWRGTNVSVETDLQGNFKIQKTKNRVLEISYIGYALQVIEPQNLSYLKIELSENTSLDEVVISTDKDAGYKKEQRAKSKEKSKAIQIQSHKSFNIHSFEIAVPYSIPSNGESYDVLLQTHSVPFDYQYVSYPSTEPTAYLGVGIRIGSL